MITIHINAPGRGSVPGERIGRLLHETLRREGISSAELSVTFVGDSKMARLHGRYLGRPQPTDVLSFALHEDGADPLGDIYVGHDQALRQAKAAGIEPAEEMARLAVHGALHVLGYDHPSGADREGSEMFRLQERLLDWMKANRPDGALPAETERVGCPPVAHIAQRATTFDCITADGNFQRRDGRVVGAVSKAEKKGARRALGWEVPRGS